MADKPMTDDPETITVERLAFLVIQTRAAAQLHRECLSKHWNTPDGLEPMEKTLKTVQACSDNLYRIAAAIVERTGGFDAHVAESHTREYPPGSVDPTSTITPEGSTDG